MKTIFRISIVIAFLFSTTSAEAQLTKNIQYQFDTIDGVYCDVSMAHWFDPTVQAIQDRLDLQDFGIKLDRNILIKLMSDVSAQSLSYTLYQPQTNYSTKKPLIIFAHGGAYTIGGRKSLSTVMLCEEFARRGYATASIEYRLKAISTMSMVEAGYMAMQDGNAAIKYFRANANKYGIDPDRIFIAGISAGGILALHAAHFDDTDDLLKRKQELNEIYGCHRCTGDYVTMDNEVAGVISIVGATTSPDILDDIPTLHIYTPTDSVVPANQGIPLAHLKSTTKLPGLIKTIVSQIERPMCFGPIHIQNNYNFKNHTYHDINAITNSVCDHTYMTARKGQPTIAGLKTIELVNEWLMKQLRPTFSKPFKNVSNKNWNLFNVPKGITNHQVQNNPNFVYQKVSNTSFKIKQQNPGNHKVQVELFNDLGLSTLASISSASSNNSSGRTISPRKNSPVASNKSNYLIYTAAGLSLLGIGFLFFKLY